MADTEKAIMEIDELIRVSREKLDESVGIDIQGVGKLTVNGYKSVGYQKAVLLRDIDEANLRNIDATAPSELRQVIPLLEELKTILTSKESNPKTYEKIISKFVAFGSWAKVVIDLLHYTGHI